MRPGTCLGRFRVGEGTVGACRGRVLRARAAGFAAAGGAYAEEVEVDVGGGEDGAEEGDPLRLREPREEDAHGQDRLVEHEEVDAALDDDNLADRVGREDEGEWALAPDGGARDDQPARRVPERRAERAREQREEQLHVGGDARRRPGAVRYELPIQYSDMATCAPGG
jgi:hypothetical protein